VWFFNDEQKQTKRRLLSKNFSIIQIYLNYSRGARLPDFELAGYAPAIKALAALAQPQRFWIFGHLKPLPNDCSYLPLVFL